MTDDAGQTQMTEDAGADAVERESGVDGPDPESTGDAPLKPPSGLRDEWLLVAAVVLVAKRAWAYLAPVGLAAVAGAFGVVAALVVNAWTTPTMLREGTFTSTHTSTATLVVAAIAGAVVAVLAARAMILVALQATGDQLDHPVDPGAARAQVRRRWPLVIILAVALAAATVAVWWAAASLRPGTVLPVAVALVVVIALELLTRAVVVAAVHQIGPLAAARRVIALRHLGPPGLLIPITVPLAAALWGLRLGAEHVPAPYGPALLLAGTTVLATLPLVLLTVALTRRHLVATREGCFDGRTPLPWTGIDRSARPAAGVSSSTPRIVGWRRLGVATLALLAAPAVFLLVAATNPTPAPQVTVLTFAPEWAVPTPVMSQDGTLLLAVWKGMSECVPGDECRVVSLGELPLFEWHNAVAATADPDGAGVALAVHGTGCFPGEPECGVMLVLVTCAPANCFGEDVPSADRTIAQVGDEPSSSTFAVAAHDGSYAIVASERPDENSEDELVLTLCATASCQDPRTFPLGQIDFDMIQAQYAPDGTLWVVRTDEDAQVVRAWTLAPGASTPAEAFELDMPARGVDPEVAAPFSILNLAIRDDGTPVLLHRDLLTDSLVLTSCDDTRCTDRTTTTLPIDPADSSSASLAVDATGRPILATAGRDGVLVHSCTDRACTDVRTGLVSDGYPVDGTNQTQPFMTLDAQGRPVFAVTEQIPNPDDPYPGYYIINRTLWCEDTRCGL